MKSDPGVPEGLLAASHDGVLQLTFDRPARRNALTDDIVEALTQRIEAAGNDETVRAIVINATGEHFCSGFDLAGRADTGERPRVGATQRRMRGEVNRLIPTMLETQTPIVVAARGWVIGLGLDIALAADFAVVADDARLWAPFTSLGFTPDSGSSWLIPRLVGVARAKEMLLLAREISGERAAEWGLVHRAVASTDVDTVAHALAEELSQRATVAVGLAKLLVHRGLTADLDRHLADEAFAMELSTRSEDFREHATARREKRPPKFQGR